MLIFDLCVIKTRQLCGFLFCVCVFRFLPSLARSSLQKNLMNCSIQDATDPADGSLDYPCEFQSLRSIRFKMVYYAKLCVMSC